MCKAAGTMIQKMLFCFTNNSAEIFIKCFRLTLLRKHHILVHFCQMLLPLKALQIIGAKAALLWHQRC
jgi:hypothetical protein